MSSIHRNLNYPDNQRGWVLVVGLVILVMLTILSMALMKTTRLEEKMAGATRDMNLSFQAAETALRAAETFIESKTEESFFDETNKAIGIYGPTVDEDITVEWDDDNSAIAGRLEGDPLVLVPLELEGVAIPAARFMIKQLEQIGDATVFRVTVRGTGGTNNRATLLRSHYAKVFGADSSGPEGRLSWEQLFPSQ